MKVAVLGSGGREHALVWKMNQSERIEEFFCVPGNPGIAQLAKCVSLPLHDHQSLIHWTNKEGISLTIVGPEDPLSNGIVDSFKLLVSRLMDPTKRQRSWKAAKHLQNKSCGFMEFQPPNQHHLLSWTQR